MASKSLETRELQRSRYQSSMESRRNELKEKGLADAEVVKDSKIKQFKAKIKQVDSAIARISFLNEQTKQLEEKKAQRKAEAEAERAAMIAGETRKRARRKKKKRTRRVQVRRSSKPAVPRERPPRVSSRSRRRKASSAFRDRVSVGLQGGPEYRIEHVLCMYNRRHGVRLGTECRQVTTGP